MLLSAVTKQLVAKFPGSWCTHRRESGRFLCCVHTTFWSNAVKLQGTQQFMPVVSRGVMDGNIPNSQQQALPLFSSLVQRRRVWFLFSRCCSLFLLPCSREHKADKKIKVFIACSLQMWYNMTMYMSPLSSLAFSWSVSMVFVSPSWPFTAKEVEGEAGPSMAAASWMPLQPHAGEESQPARGVPAWRSRGCVKSSPSPYTGQIYEELLFLQHCKGSISKSPALFY